MKTPTQFKEEIRLKRELEEKQAAEEATKETRWAENYVKTKLPDELKQKLLEIETGIREVFYNNDEYDREDRSYSFSLRHTHDIITTGWLSSLKKELEPKGYEVTTTWEREFVRAADEDPGNWETYDKYTISW